MAQGTRMFAWSLGDDVYISISRNKEEAVQDLNYHELEHILPPTYDRKYGKDLSELLLKNPHSECQVGAYTLIFKSEEFAYCMLHIDTVKNLLDLFETEMGNLRKKMIRDQISAELKNIFRVIRNTHDSFTVMGKQIPLWIIHLNSITNKLKKRVKTMEPDDTIMMQ